jgi:hypothetical protein
MSRNLKEVKILYKNQQRKYKTFGLSFFCKHEFVEQSEGCLDAAESYQCKKCGGIITDDFYNDSYYIKKVREF